MRKGHSGAARRIWAAVLACLCLCASPIPSEAAPAAPYTAFFSRQGLVKKGDRGEAVRSLQEILSALGYKTEVDGVFGEGTKNSLAAFQTASGLRPDGVAGGLTLSAMQKQYYRKNPPAAHTVQSGETLSTIAERYAISVSKLVGLNGLRNPDSIYAGQVLYLKEDPSRKPQVPTGIDPNPAPSEGPGPVVALPEPVVPAPTKRVCLSFNDGPDVNTTRQILSVLDKYGIKATFFLVGDRVARDPDLAREIVQSGHVVGIHGYDHKMLSGLSATEVRRDLKRTQDAIEESTGQVPHLYRPPGGSLDRTQIDEAEKLGLTTLMWTNIGGADLGAASATEAAYRITQSAKDGGVLLLHEGLQHTLEALPSIIETLARAGFGFQNVTAPVPER